uniref:Mobile element protein n=1 Tax=Enterobacter cloacae TaxID=550 RepID=A0A0G3B6T5_ENTCL|nr:hypothetical protein [Enterobacter cloacae]
MCSSISKRDDKFITTDYLQQCPPHMLKCSRRHIWVSYDVVRLA